MIDLKILRSQPELLKQAIRNKGAKVDLDLLFELDANQAALLRQVEEMRAERNRLAATMKAGRPDPTAIAAARALREELSRLEPALNVAKSEFLGVYKQVPNIPTDDTPSGLCSGGQRRRSRLGRTAGFHLPAQEPLRDRQPSRLDRQGPRRQGRRSSFRLPQGRPRQTSVRAGGLGAGQA